MTYHDDPFADQNAEVKQLDKTLAALNDCDLGAWDRDFVDDLIDRMDKHGNLNLTPRQWEQIERLKGRYL